VLPPRRGGHLDAHSSLRCVDVPALAPTLDPSVRTPVPFQRKEVPTLNRLTGRLLVAGMLSTGVALAGAAPSSALPRDPCMDEIHWWEQMSALTQQAETAWTVMDAWNNATPGDDGNFHAVWTAHLPGQDVTVDFSEYQQQTSLAYSAWTVASNRAITFMNNTAMC